MGDIRAPDNKNLAYKDYMDGMKYKDIALKYNVSIATVKSWKTRYKWDRKNMHTKHEENKKVCIQKKEENNAKAKKIAMKIVEDENAELTEKQRLFCIYYVKNKNATLAAIKAGYSKESAHVIGYQQLKKTLVLEEIKKIKVALNEELIIEEIDIINEYMKIAFADINDYVEFGNEEVETEFGLVNKSYVRFKQDFEVDGTIISEVSVGKDGAKLKLHDKMKALQILKDKLSLDDIDKMKAEIEITKKEAEIEFIKARTELLKGAKKDTSLLEALIGVIKE